MTDTTKKIHIALGVLGIEHDDDRRALYVRVTSKAGLTAMTEDEREVVLLELHRLGCAGAYQARPRRQSRCHKLSGRYATKLQALWIAGWNLGLFRKRDDAALEAFVKRQTGLDRERFLHHAEDAARVIEALKGWMAREAGVDWGEHRLMEPWQRRHGYKIARAQWTILDPNGASRFWSVVTNLVGESETSRQVTDAQWILVMNRFGERIRAEKPMGERR